MNITVTADRSQNDQVIANLTVPADEVDKAIDMAYKDIAKKYNFQGFRRGKMMNSICHYLRCVRNTGWMRLAMDD